ncbi:MAG: protein phosphatase 2C domain-containing protein, partial [Candidatus Margulisiibacteriota bacterium]
GSNRVLSGKINQDAMLIAQAEGTLLEEKALFLAVADGMGGHLKGEEAARISIECLAELFNAAAGELDLAEAFRRAHAAIEGCYDFRNLNRKRFPAAVLTASLIEGDRFQGLNCGDSRIYLWSRSLLRLLSRDNSAFFDSYNLLREVEIEFPLRGQELEDFYEASRQGLLLFDGAYQETEHSAVTAYLGGNQVAGPKLNKIIKFDLEAGDLVLLASDALGNYLSFEDLVAILQRCNDLSPEEIVDELFKATVPLAEDNLTIVAHKHLWQ